MSPCFKYEFCSSYFSFSFFFFPPHVLVFSFVSVLFCFVFFFFCSSPYPIRLPPLFFTFTERSFEELTKILPIKNTITRFTVFVINRFFFLEISKTGRLFAHLYRVLKKDYIKYDCNPKKKINSDRGNNINIYVYVWTYIYIYIHSRLILHNTGNESCNQVNW